jgi:hypothetical protein
MDRLSQIGVVYENHLQGEFDPSADNRLRRANLLMFNGNEL